MDKYISSKRNFNILICSFCVRIRFLCKNKISFYNQPIPQVCSEQGAACPGSLIRARASEDLKFLNIERTALYISNIKKRLCILSE